MQNGCSPIRVGGYQMIRIRPSGEVETPPLPFGVKIPDVNIRVESAGYPGAKWRRASECKWRQPGANPTRVECCPDETIASYPDMLSGQPVRVYSLHGFAYGKGLQSFGSSCF